MYTKDFYGTTEEQANARALEYMKALDHMTQPSFTKARLATPLIVVMPDGTKMKKFLQGEWVASVNYRGLD